MPTILEDKEKKARKEHICCYCRGKINKGENYYWQKNIDNNQLYEWKAHLCCQSNVRSLYMFLDDEDGILEDDFCAALQESICILSQTRPDIVPSEEFANKLSLDMPKLSEFIDEHIDAVLAEINKMTL